MTASSGTPRPKSDILSSVLERARTAGAWRRAGAPINWLWRAEQREGWRRAMDAAEGAERWKAEADAAMDKARMTAVLHMISERTAVQEGGGIVMLLTPRNIFQTTRLLHPRWQPATKVTTLTPSNLCAPSVLPALPLPLLHRCLPCSPAALACAPPYLLVIGRPSMRRLSIKTQTKNSDVRFPATL